LAVVVDTIDRLPYGVLWAWKASGVVLMTDLAVTRSLGPRVPSILRNYEFIK